MTNKEYIMRYIKAISQELDTSIYPDIKDAIILRYPLYSNCIDRSFYIWEDLFNSLDDKEKKYYIIYCYAILLDADISTRNQDDMPKDYIRLAIDPNKLSRVIAKLMGEDFMCYEEMERIVYNIRKRLFPFPDPRGTYYKIGDELHGHIFHYKVIDVFQEDGETMIKFHTINSYDNITNIIVQSESEMINYYRITKPVEFQKE